MDAIRDNVFILYKGKTLKESWRGVSADWRFSWKFLLLSLAEDHFLLQCVCCVPGVLFLTSELCIKTHAANRTGQQSPAT